MIRSSPDVDTDEVIRPTVLKDLSDSVHVKATRQFVANQMTHRQQCAPPS
jgi:hypothetical protein